MAASREKLGPVEFLLECIGFPPDQDLDALIDLVQRDGEGVPWRGDPANHRRLSIGEGLELRFDRETGQDFWTLMPHFRVPHRLRVAVESFELIEDSPFDALMVGWAVPPAPEGPPIPPAGRAPQPGSYRLSAWLNDARRVPKRLPRGHVLAISIAGFALDVSYVGPDTGIQRKPPILDRGARGYVSPLGGQENPGGCADVSLRVKTVRRLRNAITGKDVELVVAAAPERPLLLFLSPWQLREAGLPGPRAGWRIEGTFLFSGRVAGGLPRGAQRVGRAFG